VAIYLKEANSGASRSIDGLKLTKGLLKALQVAHSDKNTVLFDRIKSVMSLMGKGASINDVQKENKDAKILLQEVVSLALKPTKDGKLH
jgi:hypothetical protein